MAKACLEVHGYLLRLSKVMSRATIVISLIIKGLYNLTCVGTLQVPRGPSKC